MRTNRIYTKNAEYQRLETLKTNRQKRYAAGAFFVEGVRNINEAVACGFVVESWIYAMERPLSRWAGTLIETVETACNLALTPPLMDALSGKADTSELLAIVRMREDALDVGALGENPLVLLLDRPSNHGNLGTILRSCDAMGADAVIVTGHAVDLYDPAVIAATMGSFFRVPVVRLASHALVSDAIGRLRQAHPGLAVIGTTAHDAVPLHVAPLSGPALLMIGNETDGLARLLAESCDMMATIPMREGSGASSLNIACATTVMLYEAMRQRCG